MLWQPTTKVGRGWYDAMKKGGDASSNHEYFVDLLQRRRTEVQHSLVDVEVSAGKNKLNRSVNRCLQSLRKCKGQTRATPFGQFARTALQKVSQPLRQLVAMEHFSLDELHQLRIAGKRLRYSIEVFHGAFPPELRKDAYPLVEELQNRLGRLNDHATAQRLFQGWLADMPADDRAAYLARCIVAEHEAALQVRSDFLHWWNAERAALVESSLDRFIA